MEVSVLGWRLDQLLLSPRERAPALEELKQEEERRAQELGWGDPQREPWHGPNGGAWGEDFGEAAKLGSGLTSIRRGQSRRR